MPGARPANTSKGDRGEYLAQYLLSFIGLPLPVLRQHDIGIDIFCNISEKVNNVYTYSHPFCIQLKVLNEETRRLSSEIKFGGISSSNNWKKYEIDWLLNPGMPFFIGILDALGRKLSLYSTSSIWFAYHSQSTPTEIILNPRIYNDNYGEVHSPSVSEYKNGDVPDGCGDGCSHLVDLGQPLIILNINDVNDEALITTQKYKLKNIIDNVDSRNLVQRKLESSFFWWNKFQDRDLLAWYINPWSPRFNPDNLLNELMPILVPLALFYKDKSSMDKLEILAPILNLIKDKIPQEIKEGPLKEIFKEFNDQK